MNLRPLFPLMVATTAACTLSAYADPLTLRTTDTHPPDYPTVQALYYMSEHLARISDGRLNMKIYPGGQLGEEKDSLEITIFGGIDLNRVNLAPLNSIVPETIVLGMPFIFESIEHMRSVVDGPIGDDILAAMEPHGLIGLAFYDSGARSFYNVKRPIQTPADLEGMKIRVQNSELFVEMVSALGANPTPMSFGEVYESLVLGTIDGSENNWPSYESTRHYEVAGFYTRTEHSMAPEVLVMSKHRWERLSDEDRRLIREAARASVPVMRRLWDERVARSRELVFENGNEVIEVVDKAPFRDAVRPVYDIFLTTPALRELAQRILDSGSGGAPAP